VSNLARCEKVQLARRACAHRQHSVTEIGVLSQTLPKSAFEQLIAQTKAARCIYVQSFFRDTRTLMLHAIAVRGPVVKAILPAIGFVASNSAGRSGSARRPRGCHRANEPRVHK
jgi:hypothetical protein